MNWFQRLLNGLSRPTVASAQRKVERIERQLAMLRASIRHLSPEDQTTFASKVQALIEQQAHAHTELNNALDDRRDR